MALIPNIKRILNMFDPITLPSAMSVLSFNALVKDTTSSGADVPKATIVNPITMGAILNRAARLDAPSTRKSAPLTSIIKPIAKRTSSTIL